MAQINTKTKNVDGLGNVAGADILVGYQAADLDDNTGGTSYYGFVDTAGNWYIQKKVDTGVISAITFARGTSDYATNWTGRAGLSYDVFSATF